MPTSKEDLDEPTRDKSSDGIYPRCVYCGGEIYGPAVYDYSLGKIGCGVVNGCGRKLPPEYVTMKDKEETI